MSTRKDTQCIIELIDQGLAAGERTEAVIRRITEQMPHVTVDDIAHVAEVHAEERDLDASVRKAQAEAGRQIVSIVRGVQRSSGIARLTLGEACVLLMLRAQRGDKRAVKLLDKLDKAAPVFGLEEATGKSCYDVTGTWIRRADVRPANLNFLEQFEAHNHAERDMAKAEPDLVKVNRLVRAEPAPDTVSKTIDVEHALAVLRSENARLRETAKVNQVILAAD